MQDQRKYFIPITPVNDNLLCKICLKVALNSLECVQCESLFCEQCTKDRKVKINTCPQCQGEFITKQPHRLVKQELSQIQFYCANRQQGCKQELKMSNVLEHAASCQYVIEKCKCGWQGRRTDYNNHEKGCPLRATQMCPTCKQQIQLNKYMTHNCIFGLKENIEKLAEKFIDYKESSQFSIKELKNESNQLTLQIQDLSHHQAVLVAEHQDLKEGIQNLFKLFKQQELKLKQLLIEQETIPENNLRESATLKCSQNHDLSYWLQSKGEERKKKCQKCQRSNVNCRYYCPKCRIFLCLSCQLPEIINRQGTSFCPARHRLGKKWGAGFRCSVCDRSSGQMLRPGGASCHECDFELCFSCIDARRFQSRTQECHIQ